MLTPPVKWNLSFRLAFGDKAADDVLPAPKRTRAAFIH
jgi:hypothetical protein